MSVIKPRGELYLGLMSGTSLDGIDAALVDFQSVTNFTLVASDFTPYSPETRQQLAHLAQHNQHLESGADSPLHFSLAELYADAALSLIDQAGLNKHQIKAIANHGQTVKHEPNAERPYSLQLGDGQSIANLSGIRTICQFRQADLAAGGQGAPLMPAFHQAAFKQHQQAAVVNIGGIANITKLGRNLIGFDTGPGNCLMDQWIERNQNSPFDRDGAWADSGQLDRNLLATLLEDEYFHQAAPKSTGTDYFNLDWLQSMMAPGLAAQDVQRTLLGLTTETIAREVERHLDKGVCWICGGGSQNVALMNSLKARLAKFDIQPSDNAGIPSDFMEAMGFAWLGFCFDENLPSNAPGVTGADKACVLGEAFVPA